MAHFVNEISTVRYKLVLPRGALNALNRNGKYLSPTTPALANVTRE